MNMEWITIGAQPVVLFLLPPNFATKIKVTLSVMDIAQVTQSNISSTRSLADTGKYTLEMECLCGNAQQSSDIRQGLNRLKDDLVALPLWTDAVSTLTAITGGTAVQFNPFKTPSRWGTYWVLVNLTTFVYEVVPVTSVIAPTITFGTAPIFTWPVGSVLVPLIMGRFKPGDPPTFTKLTDSVNTVKFTFEENSPITYTVSPIGVPLGTVQTNLGLANPMRMWTVPCTYAGNEPDSNVVDIDYERIGFGRQDAAFVYPQAPRRVTELAFELCDRVTIANIEGYLLDRRGRTLNIWVPTFRNDIDLLENLPELGNQHLIVVDGNSRYLDSDFTVYPGYAYLCLNDITGQPLFPFKLTFISGNILTANIPITQQFASNSKISALILSRFQSNTIEWVYETDGYATTTIKWVEATEDYAGSQFQQEVAQLYQFTNANGGGVTNWLYTSFETAITISGLGTFQPGLFSHGNIKTGIDMSSDEAEIISFQFTGNPLMLLMPWSLVGDLIVNIYEYDRLTQVLTNLFSGTVEELDTEGAKITAKAHSFGGLYDQQFHRHVMAGDCPYAVYSPECGLSRGASLDIPGVFNTITRTITGTSGSFITLNLGTGFAPDAFASGICEVTAGGAYQMVQITGSLDNVLNLARPLFPPVIGATCKLSLGCDGSLAACILFNNQANFGGENNIPNTNPSVLAVKPKDSSISKK